MALYSPHNLYRGVNAHLHSALMNIAGGWEEFHAAHIILLGMLIQRVLPTGYVISPEKSMQIREYHPTTGEPVIGSRTRIRKPDVPIYERAITQQTRPSNLELAAAPTMTSPAVEVSVEVLDEDYEIYLRNLVVRELIDNRQCLCRLQPATRSP
jgi:hypothetical protein